MKLATYLVFAAAFISGCSHICTTENFYKPEAQIGSGVEVSYYPPDSAIFSIKEVPFSVSICGDRYLAPPSAADSVCISVELAPFETLRFNQPNITLSSPVDNKAVFSLGDIEYEIFCRASSSEPQCSSSLDSPTSSPVKQIHSRSSTNRYAFPSNLEFKGADDTLHEGRLLGFRMVGKRRYLIRTRIGTIEGRQYIIIQLPEIILNGKSYTPPELNFKAVTEDVCRTSVLQ
jgi:hypothetical protein